MANTVYGPFVATNVVNGSTPANATWGNNVQTQASVALNGLNGDICGPSILSGIAATKDGTLANQLDVTNGIAYCRMSDNSVARITTTTTTFTTSTPSTTYYLDLNPDASWSWGTAHSAVANHLLIAQCTTDASGNISAVTDNRNSQSSLGIPVIVYAPAEAHVTDTALHDPLFTFTVPMQGLYRVSGSLYKSSGVTSYIYGRTSYSGVHSGAEAKSTFLIASGGGTLALPLQANYGGASASLGDGEYGLTGPAMYVANGGFIHVSYQDVSGTPNDYLLIAIERLR